MTPINFKIFPENHLDLNQDPLSFIKNNVIEPKYRRNDLLCKGAAIGIGVGVFSVGAASLVGIFFFLPGSLILGSIVISIGATVLIGVTSGRLIKKSLDYAQKAKTQNEFMARLGPVNKDDDQALALQLSHFFKKEYKLDRIKFTVPEDFSTYDPSHADYYRKQFITNKVASAFLLAQSKKQDSHLISDFGTVKFNPTKGKYLFYLKGRKEKDALSIEDMKLQLFAKKAFGFPVKKRKSK